MNEAQNDSLYAAAKFPSQIGLMPSVPVEPLPDLRMSQGWITELMLADSAVSARKLKVPVPQAGVLTRDAVGNLSWGPGGSSAVTSVFGRTAAVIAQAGDYTAAQVGAEPALGNPAGNGMVLTSTTGGVRSWVTALSLVVLAFFGYDDLTSYSNGPLDAPSGGLSWAGVGTVSIPDNTGWDDLTSYANGALDNPNGGYNWGGAGVVSVPN